MFYHSLALLEVMQSLKAKKNCKRWILKQTDIYLRPWGLVLFCAGGVEELCVVSAPIFAKASYL